MRYRSGLTGRLRRAVRLDNLLSLLEAPFPVLLAQGLFEDRAFLHVRQQLVEGRDAALLSRRLTEIAVDAPLPEPAPDLRWRGPDEAAVDELFDQTRAMINFLGYEKKIYPHRIAFNCLPHIDRFQDNGYTREEMKMVWETRKIMGDDSIQVNPTAVRVPVFYGHSEAVHIETRDKLTADKARDLLASSPGIVVLDKQEDGGYPTAVTEGANQDPVYVGRIREDISHPRGLDMWIVSDNVRKGAALNAVQIAELLGNRCLKKG